MLAADGRQARRPALRWAGAALIACCLGLAGAAPAAAAPETPLGHSGRWVTDAGGRVVILHGVNMVYKRDPFAPDAAGFGEDDAEFLAEHGFNTVRLGLIYAAVEPAPGDYDDVYLDRIAGSERILAEHGIFSQLDFHQDLYGARYGGEGWPDWATIDDGVPAEPLTGFPGTYVSSPGMNQAFNNFWLNRDGPGGVGLQNRYAAAFKRVAERFADRQHTIGFDLMNEPWPGTQWPTCANPVGCPIFDTQFLAPFHDRVIARIREAEPQKLIWYEPNVIFNFGADSQHPATGDPQTGFSFHVYCLAGAFAIEGTPPEGCETFEELTFENADKQAEETGDALLLSEFGATDDLEVIRRNIEQAETHMISWQYWHYCACDDPTTSGPGVQAVVIDAAKPPEGDNVKHEKLDLLSRPYPQAVAGTPERYDYDEDAGTFELEYSTTGPAGESFASPAAPETEVFIPREDFPDGYDADADGGIVVSTANATTLRVRACPRAERVSIRVSQAGQGTPGARGCPVRGGQQQQTQQQTQHSQPDPLGSATALRRLALRLAPRRAVAGRRTCFAATVSSAGGPQDRSRVSLGRKSRHTNGAGRARICRRFSKPGKRTVSASKPGFAPASAVIAVRRTERKRP